MSTFSFNDYQNSVNAAQNRAAGNTGVRVGWFKLANDGDTALVRINLASTDEMKFAAIHQLGASANWMKVNCACEFGSFTNNCPFCNAANNGNASISKQSKRVYIPMVVSYQDKTTGQWSAPQPVIWDKPAGFSREVANKIRDFGDLRQVMFKVTRNGAKGDLKTTYSMDYAVPTIFKPELIPIDFSAFNNFKLEKHSFHIKSIDDMNTYLATGSFPEVAHSDTPTNPTASQVATAYGVQPQVQAQPQQTYQAPPVVQQQYVNPEPQSQVNPAQKFNGFSF